MACPGCGRRATLIGGKLTIWSQVDEGTEVELLVPASAAYAIGGRPSWFSAICREREAGTTNAGSSQIRILAVDDYRIVRQGIAGRIGIQTDMVLEVKHPMDTMPSSNSWLMIRRHADGLEYA